MGTMKTNRETEVGLGLLLVVGLFLHSICARAADSIKPAPHPLPASALGVLYGGAPVPPRASVTSVNALAGQGHLLYVALTEANGHELVDLWDTKDPTAPRRLDTVDFGDLRTNKVAFVPLSLIPFQGGILLQTREGLSVYRLQPNNRLSLSNRFPAPNTTLGLGMTQMSVAGKYASLLQQVIPNDRIDGHNLDQIHRQVLMDLNDPANPFLFWTGSDGPSLTLKTPINGALRGDPASLVVDQAANQAQLTVFRPALDTHLSDYWTPKLRGLFSEATLGLSLKELVARALEAADAAGLQREAVRIFASTVAQPSLGVGERILQSHAFEERMDEVLPAYRISLNDSLEAALAKVVGAQLLPDLLKQIGEQTHGIVLQKWSEQVLPAAIRQGTLSEVRTTVAGVLNQELGEIGVARYLTRHVVSPLLGNPRFMEMTLQDLIDSILRSEARNLIDATLQTVGGYGALNEVLDAIDDMLEALDWLPGVDVPGLPKCARFPESTAELIDLALFSWNDASRSLVLDRAGFAWFELLKLYRYYRGDVDFPAYTADLDRKLRLMQEELGGSIIKRVSGAYQVADADAMSLRQLSQTIGGEMDSQFALSRVIARGVIDSLNADGSLAPEMPLRDALQAWGLRVDQPGMPEASVGDLVEAVRVRGLAETQVSSILGSAEHAGGALFQQHLEQALRKQIEISFGVNDLHLAFADLLKPFLVHQADLHEILGHHLSGMLNQMLGDGPGMSDYLSDYAKAFEGKDCIAQWLVAADVISVATSGLDGGSLGMALKIALREGYHAAVGYLVDFVFGMMIREVMDGYHGSQSHWIAAKMRPSEYRWSVTLPNPSFTETVRGAFLYQDRAGFLVEKRFEADWFGPRALELHLVAPEAPDTTRKVYDLGRWQHVNYVHHQQGALCVGGSFFTARDGAFPSGKCAVIDLDGAEPRIQVYLGQDHVELASNILLSSANHDAALAVGSLNRVYLLPNPASHSRGADQPDAAPILLEQPQPVSAMEGETVVMRAKASGTAPLHYEWRMDGVGIPGGVGAVLTLTNVSQLSSGSYSVVVTNAAGSVTSAPAALSVLPVVTLRISGQPSDVLAFAGQSVRLSVTVEGAFSPSYQWYHGSEPIPGGTSAVLNLTNLSRAQGGAYYVVVESVPVVLQSRHAVVRVLDARAPQFVKAPGKVERIVLGKSSALTASPVGLAPVTLQWFKDGLPIAGATARQYPFSEPGLGAGGTYRVEARAASGALSAYEFEVMMVSPARLRVVANLGAGWRIQASEAVPTKQYILQRSSNLLLWADVMSGTFSPEGGFEYEDPGAGEGSPTVYYRLQVQP